MHDWEMEEQTLMKYSVTRTVLSKILGVSQPYITNLIQKGILPKPEDDKRMNLFASVRRYIDAVRPRSSNNRVNEKRLVDDYNADGDLQPEGESGNEVPVGNFQLLLLKEKWRKEKRENDVAEGLLVRKEEVAEAIDLVVSEILPVVATLHFVALRAWPDLPPAALESIQSEVAKAINRAIETFGGGKE